MTRCAVIHSGDPSGSEAHDQDESCPERRMRFCSIEDDDDEKESDAVFCLLLRLSQIIPSLIATVLPRFG